MKRIHSKCNDEDIRSECSILFDEYPLGDISEAILFDDENDEIMGEVTLAEIPVNNQCGGGIKDVNAGPSHEFWTPLPVEGLTSLDDAIVLLEKGRRPNKKYDAEEIEYFAIVDPDRLPQSARGATLGSVIDVVRRLFQILLERVVSDLNPDDLIRFVLMSDNLDRPISTNVRRVEDMTVETLMACIMRVLQSKDTILLDEGFAINVITVKRPRGSGRNRRVINPEVDRLQKQSVITIRQDGEVCCAMSILLGKAILDCDPDLRALKRQSGDLLMRRAIALHSATGVPEGPCGFDEIGIFERYLNVQVIVISSVEMQKVVYKGSERSQKVYLWLNRDHFDLIKSPMGFYGANHYCEECNKAYKHLAQHFCESLCQICRQTNCIEDGTIRCNECDRQCRSQACYMTHKSKGICDKIYQCRDCRKVIERRLCPMDRHVCDHIKCSGCKQFVTPGHLCYLAIISPKPPSEKLLFFDFETDQSSGVHVVNFAVAQYVMGEEFVCSGPNTLDQFCTWLFDVKHKGYTAIAHNLKGFDGQFIVRWLLERGHEPKVIPQGSKLMYIEFSPLSIKLIDSYNFLPMALSKLPKTFGITELIKGYFPHLFNKEENQKYVGVLPDKEFYSPETMSPSVRANFLQWYEQRQTEPFDFEKEVLKYCRSDVDILRRCCLEFRKQFMDTARVDPFRSITIASACMSSFRSVHIPVLKIAMMPPHGYINKTNFSQDSIRWLQYISQVDNIYIRHALNGNGEVKIGGMSVDGICETTNTVYQYQGCFFHGCSQCFNPDPINPVNGTMMSLLAEKTKERTEKLKRLGYGVVEKWEHDFTQNKKSNAALRDFLATVEIVDRLNPRDAFFGGRTNAIKLYHEGPAKYIDFTSLYPWCNKYARYPVGHPDIIIPAPGDTNIDQFFGIIKCKVLAPRGLYHPVLPYKHDNKLMFPLCKTCCETLQEAPCAHTADQRMMVGTWVSEELKKAIEKGYTIVKVYEVYHFEESSDTLFRSYIDLFLKIKQEASGWPTECTNDAEKERYISSYLVVEGIQLDAAQICVNPGRRAVAKLALNSFWGRWGMNRNKAHLEYVRSLENFNKVLIDNTKTIEDLYFPTENICAIQWRQDEGFLPQDTSTNIFLAAFTTCHARLKLYSELDKLKEDVLYFDTDSIVYSSNGQNDPPLGNYLGDFTDELDGEIITKFVSGGPKNYAYTTSSNKTVCKIRGFTLNYKNSLSLNFDAIERLVSDLDQETSVPITYNTIARDAKKRKVFNKIETKQYGMVYNKRVIRPDFTTIPYGY